MKQNLLNKLFYVVLISLLSILFSSCSQEPTIKVGFVGGLTGRISELGIAGRDGVMLAVEEINATGGIKGQKIELVIKDDAQNPEIAAKVDKELIKEGAVAIIGHMTSSMSMVGVPIANSHKVLMLSPTTSTNDLSDKDDFFFRVYPVSAAAATKLASHAFNTRNYKRISVLYDTRNRAHSESWYNHFKTDFEDLGGKIIQALPYHSDPNFDFQAITEQLTSQPTDAIFILANAIDTAMACQQLSKERYNLPILVSEWSVAGDIVQYGGKSVEGIEFFHTFNDFSQSDAYISFVKKFQNRFQVKPNFASVFAYEAATVLFTTLGTNSNPTQIRETLLEIASFPGLQGELKFSNYGDITRDVFLMTINDGTIQPGELSNKQ